MKKVLFLITKATWGGAQRYVYDLATHLPRPEFRPIVAYGQAGHLSHALADAGIQTLPIEGLGRDVAIVDDIGSFFTILRTIKAARPDIVHLNSSKAAALGALAARILRVPKIIFTVHGWPFKEERPMPIKSILYLISWFTALCSHRIITVSKDDENWGLRMWGVGKKVSYIPLGIDPPRTVSREEALTFFRSLTSSERVPGGTVILGTIAELTENKGLAYALEAFHELQQEVSENFVYVIIGEGALRNNLEALIKKLDLGKKVFLLGFVEDASRYLRGFDIFLLPSIKEGMPYVLLEAGEAGIPTITTTAVSPEVVTMYEHMRRVPSHNSLALADAIRHVREYSRPSSSIERVEHFPLSRMVRETTSIY